MISGRSRGSGLWAALLLLLALSACKLFKKEEPAGLPDAAPAQEPAPEAASEPSTTATAEATAEPATPGTTVAGKPSGVAVKDAGVVDAAGAASADAAAAPKDAGVADASGAKAAACQSKCQAILQVCLTPGVTEAGLPTLADPSKCKTAFDDCAAACK